MHVHVCHLQELPTRCPGKFCYGHDPVIEDDRISVLMNSALEIVWQMTVALEVVYIKFPLQFNYFNWAVSQKGQS